MKHLSNHPLVKRPAKNPRKAFSLVEMLTVMGIIAILAAAISPAFISLQSSGDVTRGAALTNAFLVQARVYARANNTTVRVGFHESAPGDPDNVITLIAVSSATGNALDNNAAALNNEDLWPMISRPVRLRGLSLDDTQLPASDAALGTDFTPFNRPVNGNLMMEFARQLQFDPEGLIRSEPGQLHRHISVGLMSPREAENLVILRLSGASGYMETLRDIVKVR